ncbi:MAG: PLP-dependent aminotransferase family protein [SAR202 cluster bacterium]|nr:PLP-dependent aminotransferase family protein [SAR202 cluster bacterium]RZP17021.1 MAG: PLP-dependent aminotransferase family protein [Chloroflexota bacterium]|tara:strand:- start:5312 stop:6523 length:1212 start_codon:yes stop_codon:yes gene_type:complete
MSISSKFNFDNLWSEKSTDADRLLTQHAKYDFAVAYPPFEAVPMYGLIDGLKSKVDANLEKVSIEMAYYPHVQGDESLREFTANKIKNDRGIRANKDSIVLCNGSGEANGLVIQALIDPGDYVITEQFVYMGTTKQLTFYEANTVGSPIDDQGLIPEKLEETILNIKSQHGVMPKMLYTIPEHQNPTGSTLPKSRKLEILDICHKYGIPILEDDCYVDNRFEGDPEPAFATLDDSGMVIYVGSFSKLIAPGLRMGFFTASDEVIDRALSVKVGSGPNQFTAYAIDGFLRNNLESQKSTYDKILKDKKESMEKGLVDFFSNTSAKWSSPKGGCYTWIEMTDGANLTEVRDEVFSRGVGYIAGDMFAPNGDGQNMARLCFSFEPVEKNYEGIKELASILKDLKVI